MTVGRGLVVSYSSKLHLNQDIGYSKHLRSAKRSYSKAEVISKALHKCKFSVLLLILSCRKYHELNKYRKTSYKNFSS